MSFLDPEPAAWLYFGLAGLVVLFQLALALGAPWGAIAMGGRYPGSYPHHLRGAAVVQALFIGAMAAVVLVRAGLVASPWFDISKSLVWVVVAFAALSTVLNLTTPSKWERRLWGPVTVLMLITSITVATA
ncbi:MAG: hypothetical protein OEY55_04895 [Acidimicrobiia bacterium]|nr:hypothetical protein [Acidimicrobiia bacterium]MDH5421119.1 hypothetical protein [Acidimicrobiia bacterium]MDH5503896.1 hypothetical protein [Acidimicrobiia bacterium]